MTNDAIQGDGQGGTTFRLFREVIQSAYKLPAYARDMLYLDQSADAQGTNVKRAVWGGAAGPTLAYWPIDANGTYTHGDPTRWMGRVKAGGFVERLHARQIGDIEFVVAEIVGGVFAPDYGGLPTLSEMQNGLFARPADSEPFGSGQTYPFFMLADSHFAGLAQDALVSGLAVDAFGKLAAQADGWHEVSGLPLLLDGLTLLAPG